MKIAFIANTTWNIYNFRIALVNEMHNLGHMVIIVAPFDEFTLPLQRLGCKCIDIQLQNKGSNPIADLVYMWRLYNILNREKPEIALQYTIKCNIYGTLAAKILRIPVINNVSGLGTVFLHNNLTSKIAKYLYRFSFKFPTVVFFQNKDDLTLFVNTGLVDNKICDLLPGSGVDLDKFSAQPYLDTKPFEFIMVARLLHDKGVKEYAAAAKIIKNKFTDVKFHLVGPADFVSGLGIDEDTLNKWIDSGQIIYHSFTTNIVDLIKSKSCMVLPSYREGTARTLLEALALAKPIITTNVPGCRETVQDGINGFLCEPKDTNSLAKAFEKILSLSYHERALMALKSREIAEINFNQSIVVNKYLKAIQKSVKNIDI